VTILAVDPVAPWYVKGAADALLVLHIGGGGVGMVSGFAALAVRKGSHAHAIAGTVFFVSMLAMASVGATVSPFLPDGFLHETTNVVAAIMTLYLLITSWAAIRHRDGQVGRLEIAGLATALAVCAAAIVFILIARSSPTGTIGDTPPQAFYVFLFVGGFAAGSDLRVILKGSIKGSARIARHLWRMCLSLSVATGSFFLGQQKFLPTFLHGSPLLFIPVFAPLVLMFYWLIRVRQTGWFKARKVASPQTA
jgi:hypothetical protein